MEGNAANRLNATAALWTAKAAGIFTWDVVANVLFGDAVIADLFGLDATEAVQGLPLQDYIAGMHPDDRPRVARSIHAAVVSCEPYQEEYRLLHRDCDTPWVLAIGHCFRNRDGVPSVYAGVIYDITAEKTSATDGLSNHCHAALHLAERLDNPKLITLLQQAIEEASSEDRRDKVAKSAWH